MAVPFLVATAALLRRLLWVPLACAATLCAQPAAPAALYTEFERQPSAAMMDSIRGETDAIMGRMGIDLEWRELAAARGNEVSAQLAVIRFRGRGEASGVSPRRAQPGSLGWTHESDGVVLPFGAVDCDRLRSFLQLDLLGVPAAERDQVFGRAVGRVLAHELYHIFTRSRHHSPGGVGKAEFGVRDLLAAHFVFDEGEAEQLRKGQWRIAGGGPAH